MRAWGLIGPRASCLDRSPGFCDAGSTRTIFIIRHGEKPVDTPEKTHGVEIDGKHDKDSLVPAGWQRAGAIQSLFTQDRGGFGVPTELYAPTYGDPAKHRTYQTIQPLSLLLGVTIDTSYAEGQEAALGEAVAAATSGTALICWEHTAIHMIANAIPVESGTSIPQSWPGDRFDVVWRFAFDAETKLYGFSQIPQMLMAGDSATIIPA